MSDAQLKRVFCPHCHEPIRIKVGLAKAEELRGYAAVIEANHKKRNYDLELIIQSLKNGEKGNAIARKVGCSKQYVSEVKRRAIKEGRL